MKIFLLSVVALFIVLDTHAQYSEVILYEMNWEGVDYPALSAEGNVPWAKTDEGLALIISKLWDDPYSPMLFDIGWDEHSALVIDRDHDMIVRLTVKVPSDGAYYISFQDWNWQRFSYCLMPITGGDDFQVIDWEIPINRNDDTDVIEFDGWIIEFGCGWVQGTTILKKVQLIEKAKGDETAVKAVKIKKDGDAFFNLAGQRVDASYKGIVIQNGKKRIVR